jgi:hypothetical protein
VLNYVAYLTDFTCDPDQLAEENFERLGLTAWTIHSDHMLRDPLEGHVIVYPNPEWEMFNPETHSRRLAIHLSGPVNYAERRPHCWDCAGPICNGHKPNEE